MTAQIEAASRLGAMVARGDVSAEFADETLAVIRELAGPDARYQIAWAFRDAKSATELTMREQDRVADIRAWRDREARVLAASEAVRIAIGPLMQARKPREALLLAAFQAADGRLPTHDVQQIVQDEITNYMGRLRSIQGARQHA